MNRTIKFLTVGTVLTLCVFGVMFSMSSFSLNKKFVSKDIWDVFVLETGAKSYSKANSSDIATSFSMTDVRNFLTWINTRERSNYRLMTLEEFRSASENQTLPEATRFVKTWLSDCFEDESFHTPSNAERNLLELPDEWPHKVNMLGQVCKTSLCISCKLAWFEDGEVNEKDVFEQYPPPNVGILLVQ